MPRRPDNPTPGLVIVDKPAGMTSHDIVATVRRVFGTRKVGHAGTLDPMATGVLVLGIGRATKLLGYLALTTKSYDATIRLGETTNTDDADGEISQVADASLLSKDQIVAAMSGFVGEIDQVPAAVSAIKVNGVRSYARVRAGERVALAPRRVTVSEFTAHAIRLHGAVVDVDVTVDCSSGTYIRALARDLGAVLDVGGHLTALRRTAVGPFDLMQATQLAALTSQLTYSLSAAVDHCLPRHDIDAVAATRVQHGGFLPAAGLAGTYGVFDPDGRVVALMTDRATDGIAKPVVVFSQPETQ